MFRIFLACALFLATVSWPQAARSADLPVGFDQAIERALAAAPALRARLAQTRAAQEEAARAGALPDPKLTLAIDNLPVTGSDAFDFHADEMSMKRIGVLQEFPARAKRRAQRTLADRLVDEAQALGAAEQLSVRRSTSQAWIALWAAERELAAVHDLREQSLLAIRLAKLRLANGTGSAADAMATQAEGLALDNRIESDAAGLEAARAGLARWLNVDAQGLATRGAPPDLNNLPFAESALLDSIEAQAPLLAWRSREASAEAAVTLAAAQKRPDWSLGAAYGQRVGDRSDMLTVEFSIDLPLFTTNRQDRGIAARRADLDAVFAAHEEARRAQLQAVREALAQWQGLKRQIARKQAEMLPLAHDRSQVAVATYRGGGELQPWLTARHDEIALQVDLAQELAELGRAWAALAFVLPSKQVQP